MNNPKYIEIDGTYYSSLIIVNYVREQNDLIFQNIIDTDENIYLSIFYEKQDTYKVIKDLTYNIGNVGVDLENIGKSRQDYEIAAFTYNDAKYIRKQLQIDNEELYYIYTYVTVFSNNKKDLEYKTNKIEGLLRSRGMQTKKAYFRQEQVYQASLPLLINSKDIKEVSKRNILTSSISATYPLISSSLFDENGIFIGTNVYNNSLIFIDKYNRNKYKNSNMCIFGTSGSGKSFFTKLMILRNSLMGLEQYIIDPDREYNKLAEELNASIIKLGASSESYINIFDIREESLEEDQKGYLATKINKLINFFNLIFNSMTEIEKSILEEKIIQIYEEKGITFNDKTLYKNKKFKTTKDMPILEDLYNKLEGNLKTRLKPFVYGSLSYLNKHTNVELNNSIIIADIYELGEENIKFGMYIFIDVIYILLEPQ